MSASSGSGVSVALDRRHPGAPTAIDGPARFIQNPAIRPSAPDSQQIEPFVTGLDDRPVERCLRPRGFDAWLLHYSFGGHARFCLPGEERIVGPGEAILYRPGTPQDYDAPRRWSFFWAVFQPRAEWHEFLRW